MVAASTAFSPSSTMTASLVESTGLPSAAIPVHEDGNNGNGDSSADGSGDDGGMVRSLSLWNYSPWDSAQSSAPYGCCWSVTG